MAGDRERLEAALHPRYAIERELGRGGMATVYLARDEKHGRAVAVKVFEPELAAAVGSRRFEREIEVVARLRHPHILPLHDSGVSNGISWYVMPFVEGESLRERLKREGHLPVREAMRIAREVADALSYAHARGVVHRDVKPGNIMLEANHAVVTDFGIAALTQEVGPERLTQSGMSPGTPLYMSPEQAAGQPVDHRSDIYSLGCVLYEMLAGEPPFTGPSSQVIMARKIAGEVRSLRVVRDAVPEALERITERCLETTPADRFQEATELAEALGSLRARIPTPAESIFRGGLAPAEKLLRVGAVVGLGLIGMLTIGFLSTKAFDLKLGVPATHSPTRSDHLVVGAQALVNVTVLTLVAIVVFVAAKYAFRRVVTTLTRVPGLNRTTKALDRHVLGRWDRLVKSAGSTTLAETFFLVTGVAAVLVLSGFRELLSALWTTETAALACAERPLHRAFTITMTAFVVGAGGAWFTFFRWLGGRSRTPRRHALARWGSLAIIVVMLLALTTPWRLLWDGAERVRIGGERGYLVAETSTEWVIYETRSAASAIHPKEGGATIERLGVLGIPFEEPEAFASGRRKCQALTLR